MTTTINPVETKAEQLRNALIEITGINQIGFICSETDFGASCYLTFDNYKIRISDHEATNSVRVEREIMFKFTDSIEKMVYTMEQILFPERFQLLLCAKGQKPTHIISGKFYVKTRI